MIGQEGMIGVEAVLGENIALGDVIARTPVVAYSLPLQVFRREMARRGVFEEMMTRYSQSFFSAAAQSAACNGLHSARQRCCRWLLATSDRLGGGEIGVTHEVMSMMLGLRRPTVTLVLDQLVKNGSIWHRRGAIQLVNRPAIESAACECYRVQRVPPIAKAAAESPTMAPPRTSNG
jgi:CRP-like cAMP-binding protein